MEGPLFQGSGEGMVPGAPGPARNGGIDGRHTLPAHTTPALRSGLPFTPSGGGHSSAGTWSSYSPFRGTEAGDYEETMKRHLCSHGLEFGTSSLVWLCSRCQMLRMQGFCLSL